VGERFDRNSREVSAVITRQLDKNFDMQFGHSLDDYLHDALAVGQNIKTRLLLILGEWFLNINVGMPWRTLLGPKPAATVTLEDSVRQTIVTTVDVVEITAFSFDFDHTTRKATINVTVLTVYGTSVSVEVTTP
jgi:hypothetical protein